ncbi:MAG TPA: serine hydrolase [Chthoniobacterales bacterium]|jgi:beta-lactamase class A
MCYLALNHSVVSSLLGLFFAAAVSSVARGDFHQFQALSVQAELSAKLNRATEASLKEFPKLTADNLAFSVLDLSQPERVIRADYHGDASFYPASLVKLFFMVAAYHRDHFTPEIERALREMIHVSDNDAAAFLVDVLTDTTSGPELEGKALEDFLDRRRSLNRYFASLGYDVSVFIKPWSFGPFGRDMQIMGENKSNRNRASANAIASLLFSIVQRRAVSASASDAMMALLERPLDPMRPDENQVKDFFGESLPPGSRLWSKEGDTSEVRHDAAYIELPGGKKYIIVILTRGAADDKTLLPGIGRILLRQLDG